MKKAFVYGMSVEGENFTDRVKETKRLKMDFENGINVVLVSPRRIGKSSMANKMSANKMSANRIIGVGICLQLNRICDRKYQEVPG